MHTENSAGLNELLEAIQPMRRSPQEFGKYDWMHNVNCLRSFSESALKTVALDLTERWNARQLAYRPSKEEFLGMLEAASQAEAALTVITRISHRYADRPTGQP